jgi:hypothetical protein
MNKEEIIGLTGKINKKALASAIGIMVLSWAALPIVYWLIIQLENKDTEDKENGK